MAQGNGRVFHMGGYGQHRHHWVKQFLCFQYDAINYNYCYST